MARILSVALWLLAWAPSAAAQEAGVAYTLTDEPGPDGDAGAWRVEAVVDGLAREDGALRFESHAGPLDPTYLEILASDPPIAARSEDGAALTLEVPDTWNGRARLLYRVRVSTRGSSAHRRHDRRPSRADGYAFGYAHSVLLRPVQGGRHLDARVAIELVAAGPERTIVSGWAGRAQGRQRVEPEYPRANAPIAFGEPAFTAAGGEPDLLVETFQFSRGRNLAPRVLQMIGSLAPAIAGATGRPALSPSRTFLTDALHSGMSSRYGLHLNLPADAPEGHEDSPLFATVAAHELLHEWLGLQLTGASESLTWVHEGFTEYFALWLTASTGLASAESFAETLSDYDRFARESTSLGAVAFADPGVRWRDGNGPNELMAYRGAPVLALALDVELRARGQPGLLQLVHDLFEGELYAYTLEDLREWFTAHGLEQVWVTSVAGREVPSAPASLRRAGFRSSRVPLDVAYLGIETSPEGAAWRVLGVDPDGPAAPAGVEPGDLITTYYPDNGTSTALEGVDTRYTFGLARFTLGVPGAFLAVQRGDERLQLDIEPEARPWGRRLAWSAGPATRSFFEFAAR